MSATTILRPPSPPAGWQTVRPWTPRLALNVREITPVSATFVLSTINPQLSDDDEIDDSDHAGPSRNRRRTSILSISDILGGGLAVKVDNTPWQRVVMHIHDDTDEEAIVILYGLMPARQYDIELAVVTGEDSIRGKITTETGTGTDSEEGSPDTDVEENIPILPNLQVQPLTPAATRPATPVPPEPPRVLTVEEHASHLLNELKALDAEKEALVTRLKAARRESQRADAALRSEIEVLKRTSEKLAQSDQRSRQKILALQEATKQLLAASVEADDQVKLVEGSLPQLQERSRAVGKEYLRVKEEALKSQTDTEEAVKADKRRAAELESELAGLNHRLEKLNHKKDKLVADTVPELEQQLAQLGKEIEEVERFQDPTSSAPQDEGGIDFDHESYYPHHYVSNSGSHNLSHPVSTTFNRPLQPIGRPAANPSSFNRTSSNEPPARPLPRALNTSFSQPIQPPQISASSVNSRRPF